MDRSFTLIEAPVYQGQKHRGVSLGPSFLRQLLADQHYSFESYAIHESQNTEDVQDKPYEELSFIVEREYRRRRPLFIVGGDHSLSIGSVQGLLRSEPNTKVIWIDAHADINTQHSSLSKSWHGMPLAFLTGLDRHYLKYHWFERLLSPKNLIYLGLRDLDLAEKKFLEQLGIVHFSTTDLIGSSRFSERPWAQNFNPILEKILYLVEGHPVHISLDADAFDPSLAPATGVPVQNGLNFETVADFVKKITEKSDVRSFEYVELNPMLTNSVFDATRTAQIGIDLFHLIMNINKNKESNYGIHDRFGYSKGPILHDSYFELEK